VRHAYWGRERSPMVRMSRLRAFFILVSLALAACRAGGGSLPALPNAAAAQTVRSRASLDVWTMSDAVRVRPNSPAGAGVSAIALSAAKNETVSFQIAVRAPAGGLTNVTLGATPFHMKAGGTEILATLYREYFVDVPHASNIGGRPRSLGPGIYPDGLIPFLDPQTGKPPLPSRLRAQPISLAAKTAQPYWIDVHVPANAAPGNYTATFTVRAAQGSVSVVVPLHVWHFAMPVQPSLDSSFSVWEQRGLDDDSIATDSELLSERVQMSPVAPSYETRLQPLGLKMVALGIWSGADYGHCHMAAPPSAEAVARMARQNAVTYRFDQPADEIGTCPNLQSTLVPIIQRYAREFHAAGVLDLITMAPVPALETDGSGTGRPAVDIWTMQPQEYESHLAEVRKVLAKGQHAWFYTDLGPDDYSPKWVIDAPPADYRIPALIEESLGFTGELYWSVDKWLASPWDDVEYPEGGGQFSAGEGILTYPGADAGIASLVPSMRLKWIRDGMYDADEVALLKACGRGTWALAQIRTIAAGWHGYTTDSSAIDAVHLKLAKELDTHC
jgi:Domain of unknown function (DUF4091)